MPTICPFESFFSTLFEFTEGSLELRALPGGIRIFLNPSDTSRRQAFCEEHKDRNLYFGCATRDNTGGKKENLVNIPMTWCDVDFKSTSFEAFKKNFSGFPFSPSACVESGGGLHLYWKLREPLSKEDIPALENVNQRLASYLGGDPSSCEAARVLRIPNTFNFKYQPPREVKLAVLNNNTYELSDFDFLPEAREAIGYKASSEYDNSADIEAILKCRFIEWCKQHPAEVSEPLWYAMLSNLVQIRPGGVTLCHEFSKGHPGYRPKDTDNKILHALDSSKPHSCEYINANGFDCKRNCFTNSPVGLSLNVEYYDDSGDRTNDVGIKISFSERQGSVQ
jgi:hypothetical protein